MLETIRPSLRLAALLAAGLSLLIAVPAAARSTATGSPVKCCSSLACEEAANLRRL